jgi:hypothetical protein
MKTSIFRTILIGMLVGILAFFAIKLIVVVLLIGAIFKLSGKGRWNREKWKAQKMAFTDKLRNMSDDEYDAFKMNYGKGRCYAYSNQ